MLVERFGGRMGRYLIARACFEDDSPVTEERIAVSESRETTFDQDLADRGEQAAVLRRLTGRLCEGLAKSERRGRTIAIKVRLDDFTTVTRARTIPVATNDPAVVGGRRLRAARRVRAVAAPAAAGRARGGVRGGRRGGGGCAADDAGALRA